MNMIGLGILSFIGRLYSPLRSVYYDYRMIGKSESVLYREIVYLECPLSGVLLYNIPLKRTSKI